RAFGARDRRERRIEHRLVSADRVAMRKKRLRLDAHDRLLADDDRDARAFALERDLLAMRRDDVLHVTRRERSNELPERRRLRLARALIDVEDRAHLAFGIGSERPFGIDRDDDAQAIALDAMKLALVDRPGEDGAIARKVHLAVREARPGPDVARARFGVLARHARDILRG